jgi:hypothetical protein
MRTISKFKKMPTLSLIEIFIPHQIGKVKTELAFLIIAMSHTITTNGTQLRQLLWGNTTETRLTLKATVSRVRTNPMLTSTISSINQDLMNDLWDQFSIRYSELSGLRYSFQTPTGNRIVDTQRMYNSLMTSFVNRWSILKLTYPRDIPKDSSSRSLIPNASSN